MRHLPPFPEQEAHTSPSLPESYQPPQVRDLGLWQAVTLVISLPTGPGSNAFNDPDAFFKKVEW